MELKFSVLSISDFMDSKKPYLQILQKSRLFHDFEARVPKRGDIDTRLIKGYTCIKPAMVCKPDDYGRYRAPSTKVLANIVNSGSKTIEK